MDPIKAALELHLAFTLHDREQVAESADAMVGWLEKGGFIPDRLRELFEGADLRKTLLIWLRDIRAVAEW